ncbi:RRP46 [Candida pseudojiufengensis]|uniref:RRP46 n=1 Tax=Candida pseudojiufengensis TaxID=497109 RepID=UPI002224FE31|nr:RRP46 [Candida pseudojiufengensis]KAI5966176.1 RRP46 [Candida pseudojiufengensis]
MSFQVNTSILDNADGSAELKLNNTKTIVSINGPIDPKPRQELPQQASLEIIIRPAIGLSTTREKLLEDKIRSLLQSIIIRFKYPRQLIQIVIQFLIIDENSGFTCNELNSAINCCFFALVDSDLSIFSSFASIVVCYNQGNLIFNPPGNVLETCDSHHVLCFNFKNEKVKDLMLLESVGSFTESELFNLISKSVTHVEELHQQQRKIINDKISKDYIWK